MNAWMGLALFLIVAATAVVVRIYAAQLTNRQDKLSNQAVSAAANHVISFNLSGGNTFAAGEKIAIDLPETSAFTTGGVWAAADFSFNDGTARTIAGVNQGPSVSTVVCPDGVNNVGVAVDTAGLVFRVIPCGGSFTSSAAGAFVTFTVGGAAPNGTLTNPSAAGSYAIGVLDGAGDCQVAGDICSMAVSIIDSGDVTITATVVGAPPPGGGGGGGADVTPPIITNIHTQNATTNSIDVCWNTNEVADSTVNYGLTNTYGSQQSNGAYIAVHCLTLSSLTEGATYHYQVCSKDPSNNQACSGDQTFSMADTTPPSISSVNVSAACSSATVTWTTDENSTSYVDYGLPVGPPYASTSGSATLVVSHTVILSGLTPNTQYHYRVRSGDAASNESFTSDATFVTQLSCVADTTPPIISNIQVTSITSESAHVCWDTNEAADGLIDYGITNAYGQSKTDTNYALTRCFDLTGLNPDTTYHYKLTSKDLSSNSANTADLTFKTLAAAPGTCNVDCTATEFYPYIINPDGTVRKVGGNYVQVTHLSPGIDRYGFEDKGIDFDYNDVVVDVDHRDCSAVLFSAQPESSSWHHVVRAEIYYHGVLRKDQLLWSDSHDGAGNPQTINFLHDANICNGTPPDITNVQSTAITQTGATITWDTLGTMSDSTVEYGLQASYGSTASSATLTTSHAIVLTGLTKGKLYHFRVSSTDTGSQTVISNDFTFTTLADTTPPANVSGLTATPGDSKVTLNWTNPTDADFVGVKMLRKTTSYPTDSNDGTPVYTGSGTSKIDLTVTNGVTYYYAVFAYDDVPNYSSGAIANATPAGTADTTPPGPVTNLTATPGDSQIQLNWNNPSAIDFQGVKVLRKIGDYSTGPTDGTLVYSGPQQSYLDTAVANGTLYFYTLYAYDAVPNYSTPAQAQATPAGGDHVPPGPVTLLTATAGDAQVQLTWHNPSDADWAGTRVVRKTGSNPSGPNDGTVVFDGIGDNKMDNGVTNGTKYYYGAFAYDNVLNYASGAFDDATPLANLPPPVGPSCSDSDGGKNYDLQGTVSFNGGQTETDSCADEATLLERYCDEANQHQTETHACGGGFKCSAGKCVPSNAPPSTEICGNGICAGEENSLNCPADCPIVPQEPPVEVPKPTVSSDIKLTPDALRYFATSGKIQLRMQGGVLNYYSSSVFTVMIPDPSIKHEIDSAFINFNNAGYVMRQTASYEATVTTPSTSADYPMDVIVKYKDGGSDSVHFIVRTVPRPRVLDDNGNAPLAGARVTLMIDNGGGNFGLWDGGTSSQQNPQITDADGRFGYILPIGSYKLIVERDEYATKTTLPFPLATENVLRNDVKLIKLPPKDDVIANVSFAAKIAADAVADFAGNAYVKQNAQDIAAPAATVATVANVAAAGVATATVVPYLLYLWSLLAHPFMLIARRRRKQWGVVYNSLSKLPIDLAIVRLLDAKTGRVVRSAVTDKDGRYFFIVQAGTYKMIAVKTSYVFPSDVLRGMKEDAKFIDLYHGEIIEVTKETTITANVPLDPVSVEKTPRRILLEGIARRLQKSLGVITILAMAVATALSPTPTMFAMFGANVIMYLLFRRLSITRKPKNWGIVYDDKSKKPLSNVVARIFDTRFNKLLETQVTDVRGRYAFLVGQNTYYVTFEKPGYQKQQKGPVNLIDTKEKGMHVVAVDVHLPRTEGGATPAAGAVVKPPAVPSADPGTPSGPPTDGGERISTSLPAMPPQPAGLALRTPVKSIETPIAPPVAPAPAAPAAAVPSPVAPAAAQPEMPKAEPVAEGESYEAKMLARLKKMTTGSKPEASPPTTGDDGIKVMPKPGEIPKKDSNVQTSVDKAAPTPVIKHESAAELLKELKDEASGAQNGRLLPDADQAHPEEKKTE